VAWVFLFPTQTRLDNSFGVSYRAAYAIHLDRLQFSGLSREFPSLPAAIAYAIHLQSEYGLCEKFSVGTYIDKKFVGVYDGTGRFLLEEEAFGV
jgi:hypothetical protein